MRKKANALRRRFQRCNDEYKNSSRKTIIHCLDTINLTFCEESAKTNIFGIIYKLAFRKLPSSLLLPRVFNESGVLMTCLCDTPILNAVLKQDDCSLDSILHTTIRNIVIQPRDTSPGPFFHLHEIKCSSSLTVAYTTRIGWSND